MKGMIVAALAAVQLACVQPAAAAELIDAAALSGAQRGAFAGARISLPLGPSAGEKARVGLAIAGVEHSRSTGARRLSPGVELGVAKGGKLQLAIGGRTVDYEAKARKAGVSTLGWVAIGVGTALVVGVVGYGLWLNHELNDDDRCCE